MTTTLPASKRPVIRHDRTGYTFAGETLDGFADRTDVPPPARVMIARFAAQFTPEAASKWQLETARTYKPAAASELLRALSDDEDEVARAHEQGLFDLLSDEAFRTVELHSFPTPIGKLAELVGATQRQLRYWEAQGLIAPTWLRGRRTYFRGAALRAAVLVEQPQYMVAALGKLHDDGPGDFVRLLAATYADDSDTVTLDRIASDFEAAAQLLRSRLEST